MDGIFLLASALVGMLRDPKRIFKPGDVYTPAAHLTGFRFSQNIPSYLRKSVFLVALSLPNPVDLTF